MNISTEQSALISKLIQNFISDSAPDPTNLRALVAEKQVLPLTLDFGGMCAINQSGEILSFLWDDTDHPQVESDQRVRNVALFQGSKKYPALKDLVPKKPDDARVCWSCGGTGVDPFAKQLNTDAIVCYCGGLGWVP
jgi:hypothetical protein